MRRLLTFVALSCVSFAAKAPPDSYWQEKGIEGKESFRSFQTWVNTAVQEAKELEAKGSKAANVDISVKLIRKCVDAYERMIKDGVSPNYKVEPGGPPYWTGTVEEIRKKQCDPWLQKAGTMAAAQDDPYRKALKNDKLRIALDQRTVFLAGHVETGDPQKMASAPVWYAHLIADKRCTNGSKVNTVRRYQFDGQHKLTGTAEQTFCGTPPVSAYK